MRLSLLVPLLLSGSISAAQAYQNAVLATSPLRYNKLNEGSGTTIVDSSGNGYTGTYTGVTWDGTLSPFGEPVPFWDGTNDYGNLFSAGFGTALGMNEGCMLLWFKANSAALWTDGAIHSLFELNVDASNRIFIRKQTTNNTIRFQRQVTGGTFTIGDATLSPTTWTSLMYSWSVAANQTKVYINGVQVGTTQTGVNAATGSMAAAILGAATLTPTQVWHGHLSNLVIWSTPATADKIALGVPA